MKYIAAYLLVKSRGKKNPNTRDIRDIIERIGIEYDHRKAEYIIQKFNGKNINEFYNENEIQQITGELLDEMKKYKFQKPINGDNSQYQDNSFGITMTLRLTENGPLKRYALTLIDNHEFLNSSGKKIDLQKEDIIHNANQRWHFGSGEMSTVIRPNDVITYLVWDVADQFNLNPPEGTPFYAFPFHGRHNQHFIYKNNMIFARQNGHVVTYVGGKTPFVMMPPKEELMERQTFHIQGPTITHKQTNKNENIITTIKKAVEPMSSKVTVSKNISSAPESVKNETKMIEEVLRKNKSVQNNNISIKIDCELKPNITKPIQKNRDIPIPPPSKVVIKMPSKSQLSIINKVEQKIPQKTTSESLKTIVSNENDAEKIAKFNNLMLEMFIKETRNQQIEPQKTKTKEEVFSRFKSNRRKRQIH